MGTYICYFCRSIINFSEFVYSAEPKKILFTCPQCGFEYVTNNEITSEPGLSNQEREYYEKQLLEECFWEFSRRFKLEIEHNREMKFRFDYLYHHLTPMQQLMAALSNAGSIVHFITYGISKEIIGAMKVAAAKATVVGIVSNVSEALERELKQSANEISTLQFITYRSGIAAAPHTKLVVIDGLIAFEGSTNLTTHGLRQAGRKLDRFKLVKEPTEVQQLNNDYFSPVWRKSCRPRKRVWLSPDPKHGYSSLKYQFE